jgi:hypothetical protein
MLAGAQQKNIVVFHYHNLNHNLYIEDVLLVVRLLHDRRFLNATDAAL